MSSHAGPGSSRPPSTAARSRSEVAGSSTFIAPREATAHTWRAGSSHQMTSPLQLTFDPAGGPGGHPPTHGALGSQAGPRLHPVYAPVLLGPGRAPHSPHLMRGVPVNAASPAAAAAAAAALAEAEAAAAASTATMQAVGTTGGDGTAEEMQLGFPGRGTGLTATTSLDTLGAPWTPPAALPVGTPVFPIGSAAPAAPLADGATTLLPTARPERDNTNRFFAQMDDAVARLQTTGGRRKSRMPATTGASSRRPPTAPQDAAAAVALAASARARVTSRRRAATSRRDAGQTMPLTADQAAAAGLNGPPTSSSAPAAALASAAAIVNSAAVSAMASAAATSTMTPASGKDAPTHGAPCACAPALEQMSTAMQQMSTVMSGLLQSLLKERETTAADFLALRRALAVVLANSVCSKADLAKIHSLANATSLSVSTLATASSALAYNTTGATGGNAPSSSPSQAHQQHPLLRTSAAVNPDAVDEPAEAPWAIPMQVRGACFM